jgi:hypothetical protein
MGLKYFTLYLIANQEEIKVRGLNMHEPVDIPGVGSGVL